MILSLFHWCGSGKTRIANSGLEQITTESRIFFDGTLENIIDR